MPGPIDVDEEGELAGRREADGERTRQQTSRRLEHEELSRDARVEPVPLDAHERVEADALGARRPYAGLAAPSSASIRSWRETACSARAVAIACTAAAAPERVVMHGMRCTIAASRIA